MEIEEPSLDLNSAEFQTEPPPPSSSSSSSSPDFIKRMSVDEERWFLCARDRYRDREVREKIGRLAREVKRMKREGKNEQAKIPRKVDGMELLRLKAKNKIELRKREVIHL